MALQTYRVWDPVVRWFHWINVLAVIGLMAVGTAILYADEIGASTEGKILLKTVHVWIGYVFVVNLLWRIVWAFIGPPSARFSGMLPGGEGFGKQVGRYLAGLIRGRPEPYAGHNPLARIAVTVLVVLLVVQAATGLVLAGTDVYMFPFGGWIAEWVAAPGVSPAEIRPYDKSLVDEAAYESMRAFRSPIVTTHYYVFYALLAMVVLHIVGVVVTEMREGGGIVSAMFTGKKVFESRPVDRPEQEVR